MRIRTTDCCLTQKGSGIVVMHEQLNQNECRILICSVQDFLARHSLSPESEKDLQMKAVGTGIAMGRHSEKVGEVASMVTGTFKGTD